ncbi:bifunctional DedA family/phosphatase PAP2 family protein [Pararhodobacter zhoushanensis]|uniref:LssY C-terminal domain-containing protein n=1 Tax=Pararhodobacter zhoushanensis TaxID=2479545 RepID=A0ABT3GT57_9RHOB|nr:bifunctional DedA family/phosphatase PAP2 family protein [Pararhodobacter zhoushanensis]MCW1930694.1 LssY C-terminal domain-containing protein [Pararhodobacter zhoushanensis]
MIGLDQILPSLASLGMATYWIIGAAAMLEAWFVTGVFVPGSLIVDAGGILAQQGVLDLFDLGWFVAGGALIGAELGYWTGRLAKRGLRGRLAGSKAYARAEALFQRHGGLALVIGRFLGPVSGLVPMVAALSGMPHRRFLMWSAIAAVPYAAGHLALGYVLGDTMTRLGPLATRVALVVVAVLLALAALIWLVMRAIRLFPFVRSVGQSVLRALAGNPQVQALQARFPRTNALLARRLDSGRFAGLPLTLLGVVFVYVFAVWVGSVADWLTAAPIVAIDTRLSNLAHSFWSPGILRVVMHITALGDSRVVTALAVALAVWLVLKGRRDLVLGLVVAVVGNALSVSILKRVFDRPRPEFAYFLETSSSFPSGHAAISVAFWGTACYALWRIGRLPLVPATLAAVLLAFTIGASRVYLAEHFVSDVFNGWLVGALWLVVGVAIAEWRLESQPEPAPAPVGALRLLALSATLALVVTAGWVVVFYDKALGIPWSAPADVTLTDLAALPAAPGFTAQTETLLGRRLGPVNVILLAGDDAAVATALADAGWVAAQRPAATLLLREAWASWRGADDPIAPVTPDFWDGQPNDMAYEKPIADTAARPHLRLWRSAYLGPDGQRVYVGTATLDIGISGIPPDPDAQRDLLVADLIAAGAQPAASIATGTGRSGTTLTGLTWTTDGQAAVVILP